MTYRKFEDWLNNPTPEESICSNPFHRTIKRVMEGSIGDIFDPFSPDPEHPVTKIGQLIKNDLILLEGDVIYVRENDTLHTLSEAIPLLGYYMHTDTKEARKAADQLESNFMGYFPITSNKVWRNGITLEYEDGTERYVDLKTLTQVGVPGGYPEFGRSKVTQAHSIPLATYFSLINQAVDDKYFFEKTIMYPFNQRIREKSHVLVGEGGNGKGLFMKMIKRLYDGRAYTDAPQPNFRGHEAGVISYDFIGKHVVTFDDVGDPSVAFLEWMKRMITGNLEVKTPSGAWLSVPCVSNFIMDTNHPPQILNNEAHKRRFVVRRFQPGFRLKDYMTPDDLDIVGDRGNITAGDIVQYLHNVKQNIDDWTDFEERSYGPQEEPEPS